MSKKLPDMSEITEFYKATFTDILNMLGKEKSESNHTPKFLTESMGRSGLPKILIGKHAFNLSLSFQTKDDKLSLVRIQFELTS